MFNKFFVSRRYYDSAFNRWDKERKLNINLSKRNEYLEREIVRKDGENIGLRANNKYMLERLNELEDEIDRLNFTIDCLKSKLKRKCCFGESAN